MPFSRRAVGLAHGGEDQALLLAVPVQLPRAGGEFVAPLHVLVVAIEAPAVVDRRPVVEGDDDRPAGRFQVGRMGHVDVALGGLEPGSLHRQREVLLLRASRRSRPACAGRRPWRSGRSCRRWPPGCRPSAARPAPRSRSDRWAAAAAVAAAAQAAAVAAARPRGAAAWRRRGGAGRRGRGAARRGVAGAARRAAAAPACAGGGGGGGAVAGQRWRSCAAARPGGGLGEGVAPAANAIRLTSARRMAWLLDRLIGVVPSSEALRRRPSD